MPNFSDQGIAAARECGATVDHYPSGTAVDVIFDPSQLEAFARYWMAKGLLAGAKISDRVSHQCDNGYSAEESAEELRAEARRIGEGGEI